MNQGCPWLHHEYWLEGIAALRLDAVSAEYSSRRRQGRSLRTSWCCESRRARQTRAIRPVPDPVRRSEAMTGLQLVSGKSPSRYYVTRVKGENPCCRQRILLKIRAFQSIGSSRQLAEELL